MKKSPSSHRVFIALGSNLGDREKNLGAAILLLSSFISVQKISPIYETEPWGFKDQPSFFNQVLEGLTRFKPVTLLKRLKSIEKKLGRKPGIRYGPRLIDLDILFYDDLILDEPGLAIPHPRLHERSFVLVPLENIAPCLVHPVLNQTIHELLQKVDGTGVKLLVTPK